MREVMCPGACLCVLPYSTLDEDPHLARTLSSQLLTSLPHQCRFALPGAANPPGETLN